MYEILVQVIIVCFESYYLIGLGVTGGFMTACAALILVQTAAVMMVVALAASYVHEQVGTVANCEYLDFNRSMFQTGDVRI